MLSWGYMARIPTPSSSLYEWMSDVFGDEDYTTDNKYCVYGSHSEGGRKSIVPSYIVGVSLLLPSCSPCPQAMRVPWRWHGMCVTAGRYRTPRKARGTHESPPGYCR